MDAQQFVLVVSAASAVASAIFWGAFLLGKIWSRIERLEFKVDDHEAAIREFKGA